MSFPETENSKTVLCLMYNLYVIAYRLAVLWFHTRLYLRMDPKGGTLPHRAQQKGLEVEENFILALAISRRLMRNDRSEIAVSATVLYEHDATVSVRLIRIGTDRHLE